MVHRFGDFELDPDARSLTLRRAPVDVQPRVFDLLTYLVQHPGRAIPKAELMDALWPDLNVTEASLQRAVSLARKVLAQGGLEKAIRNYVGHGYRFSMDDPELPASRVPVAVAAADIAAAWVLAEQRQWAAAAELLTRTDARAPLPADALDLWALCLECLGRPVDAIPVLIRATAAHDAAGCRPAAARAATTLAKLHLERSEIAAAGGWLDRANALVAAAPDCAENSYVLWMRSRLAAFEGALEDALEIACDAYTLAETCEDDALQALSMSYIGFYNIALGRAREGREQQDSAAALALTGRVDAVTGCLVYCNLLWSCRNLADWTRARQWSLGFESWCEAGYVRVTGSCDLHRAEILGADRSLPDALARIDRAISTLPAEEAWTIGEAHRIRGDIHAMMGDPEAARQDYDLAVSAGWDAEPGNALSLFEAGERAAALASLDRALAAPSWFGLQRRAWLLANKARLAALDGQGGLAAAILSEIDASPEAAPQPAVRALIAETRAALAGDAAPEAVRLLREAREFWARIPFGYHDARLRGDISRRLSEAGDIRGAAAEARAMRDVAQRIGAAGLRARAEALLAELAERA